MKKTLLFIGMSTGLMLSAIGGAHAANYAPVECSSQVFFSENSCDLCYEETQAILPDMQLTGLFDTWTTTNKDLQVVYQDEQSLQPIMVNLGGTGTAWSYSEISPDDMWEWTPELLWTPTGPDNRLTAQLTEDKLMKFIQQKSGTSIKLDKTDREVGEYIGMMKFPLIYRDINPTTGTESEKITHYECATYISDVPKKDTVQQVIVPTTPTPIQAVAVIPPSIPLSAAPDVETPAPKEITATQTGPEVWIMAIIALMFAPVLLLLSKKRSL